MVIGRPRLYASALPDRFVPNKIVCEYEKHLVTNKIFMVNTKCFEKNNVK